ncbi:1-phosphatidylinositol 4,5-bisphosphate phosphodiesterase delta-4 [Grifola frondosa]|uniref:Phosphoinositide phospholipase C n=1 Tax=Grifola frondosa TaxID=5627 RepID=A0A1C7MHZ3_GRIFR|nr:1-phosphatidylinositol 4,5-bisphosphate phosphodiesterase delta-4 [Grifola frondosa]
MAQSDSRVPGRILRRAANLLTTKGEPVPAIAETIREFDVLDHDAPSMTTPSNGVQRRRCNDGSLSIGGSIRRKLKEVKDASTNLARARSFKRASSGASQESVQSNASSSSSSWMRRKDHRRTQSEIVLSTRPALPYFSSVPELDSEQQRPSPPPLHTFSSMSSLPESPVQEQLISPVAQRSTMADVTVPQLLQQGVPMLKVSAKKQKRYIFKLDPDQGQIVWESKKLRIIPIETIKELREGVDARYYRQQFQLAQEYEDRWLTIMWDVTLRRLYAIRQKLMSGLGHTDMRQAVWEKQFWKGADEEADQRLDFDDVERMCRRLNINPSREDLLRRFKQADCQNRGYLDFTDFKRFVKSLKARPEVDRLYRKLAADDGGVLTYAAFERFMRMSQKSFLSQPELERLFLRYASTPSGDKASSVSSSPPQTSLDLAVQSMTTPKASPPAETTPSSPSPPSSPQPALTIDNAVMTVKGFTSFLLSTENSAFADQHGKIYHDMTRPLPEYYISSSHNTYLVGHQLVGESTIEGYIRALLHSCRSVERGGHLRWDIEPMIYHGRTLTSKVSVRDTCTAIAKYAFVASPYPIIISAEIHCCVAQQDMLVEIMKEVFGDALPRGSQRHGVAQGAYFLRRDASVWLTRRFEGKESVCLGKGRPSGRELSVDTESSSTETSASDSDLAGEVKREWRKARENEAEMIKDLKSEFKKARNVLGRVRSPGSSPSSSKSFVGSPPQSSAMPSAGSRDSQIPPTPKVKMSLALVSLLVYTVGVKCRGLNKKEDYAPEQVFSLSENTANKLLKQGMMDLIKHNRTHLVRIYPKGMRIGSTNYEPHRYWSAGAQLVALNWQTFDLGYMINHSMFQRNGRAGYVLKPLALRNADKSLLSKRTRHFLDVTVISAQQLPRPKDSLGREIIDKSILDPFVEVSVHVPDWTHSPFLPDSTAEAYSPPSTGTSTEATSARTLTYRTGVVKNNGFNPVWEQHLSLPFDLVGDMKDLVFVRFAVKQEDKDDEEPLAVYCASLGSLNLGYRHLPLHDAQLSQYLFSTLFVNINIRDV